MIVGVLATCHTQYTSDSSICFYLFNRTTLQVFVTYLTGALYVHTLWFYKHQRDNRVRSKLFVASYVYWTVHHLDSWIKIDQLDVTCFIISLFTAHHVSNVSTSIFRSLRLIVYLFDVLYCSVSIDVLANAKSLSLQSNTTHQINTQ